ncbi:gamma DNA-directed DNA polymerase [Epithele typhae]|uniref:gamma DNA-directed DNA polymerase n=1 Tax=Epithele typhae TaxID=378194 RepID=UPI002008C060|nr:gamma DNA-directed DNA polymerase [Epithele typhae]KAH9917109.1 gamma DNA-directed DNA polymerase [Epithele typhae]
MFQSSGGTSSACSSSRANCTGNFPKHLSGSPTSRVRQYRARHLKTHGLDPAQGSKLPDIGFTLPPLQGQNLDEHFHRIGNAAAQPWLSFAQDLSTARLPPKPDEAVAFPEFDGKPEDMLVFDIETLPAYHDHAIMACAATKNAWYAWISPWLLGETQDPQQLIPFGDPARVREEYHVAGTQTRFLDTMALHVAVKGISSHQRPAWKKYRKSKDEARAQLDEAVDAVYDHIQEADERLEVETDPIKRADMERLKRRLSEGLESSQTTVDTDLNMEEEGAEKRWEALASANSLRDVARLHCGIEMDKEVRNDFLTSTREEICDGLPSYLDYCANDVNVTHAVYCVVLPAFLSACPSPVSFAGALAMGSSLLTVNEEWERYLENAERTYRQLDEKIKARLIDLAVEARGMMESGSWKDDVWLRQLDWTRRSRASRVVWAQRGTVQETPSIHFGTTQSSQTPSPVLWSTTSSRSSFKYLTMITRCAEPLLTAGTIPRHHALANGHLTSVDDEVRQDCTARRHGSAAVTGGYCGGSLAQPARLEYPTTKSQSRATAKREPKMDKVYWPKWLRPGTLDLTVRNRFAPILLRLSWQGWPLVHSRQHGWTFRVPKMADFQTRATALTFDKEPDATLYNSTAHFTFYKLPHKDGDSANVGSPLAKTFMRLDKTSLGLPSPAADKKWGVILPQVLTMGTITRQPRGSELKAMVRAPPGYAIVGADVDSEELWISSVMGERSSAPRRDGHRWMTLEGTKAAGTDLHSKTASILGITRDSAKVFNYSRIYGAGMRHAVLLLLQDSPGMFPEKAEELAKNLYASTKGKTWHRKGLFGRKFWFGGSESFVFNKLEEIALSSRPQTPALGCGITDALSKENLPNKFGSDYMTSRINWVVQSSGVDYLHLLIVAMQHLLAKYSIDARYLISVHDELRYLVKEEDRFRAALALQIANLWTRSLFAYRLGMADLPQGVAFFSAVDVDHVLRKEVDMPCVTPSQPHPIPPGESLDIAATLARTNGGSLWPDGRPMREDDGIPLEGTLAAIVAWLKAQALTDPEEVRSLSQATKAAAKTSKTTEVSKTANTRKPLAPRKASAKRPSSESMSHEEWKAQTEAFAEMLSRPLKKRTVPLADDERRAGALEHARGARERLRCAGAPVAQAAGVLGRGGTDVLVGEAAVEVVVEREGGRARVLHERGVVVRLPAVADVQRQVGIDGAEGAEGGEVPVFEGVGVAIRVRFVEELDPDEVGEGWVV